MSGEVALPFACCEHCECGSERTGHDDTCAICQNPDGSPKSEYVEVRYGVLLDGRGSVDEYSTRKEAERIVANGGGFGVVRITQELLTAEVQGDGSGVVA